MPDQSHHRAMLRELSIKNFAIIDDLHMDLDDGMTVMSGETGAGKSIIINAVNLLLGSRASAKLIRTGAENAELEAFFAISPESGVARAMNANGYDPTEGLLVRRIISRRDRHRVYLNGRMATMQVLNTVTADLASVSSQHAHQGLLKEDLHLDILDQYGGLMPQRKALADRYEAMQPHIEQLAALISRQQHQEKQRELLRYQLQEIEAAGLEPDEDRDLEKERQRLRNTQMLMQTVGACIDGLYSAEGAVVDQLAAVRAHLEKAAAIDDELASPCRQLAEVGYQVEDLTETLRAYQQQVEGDENRLEIVEDRLDLINRLKRKYEGTLESVMVQAEEIRRRLEALENLEEGIRTAERHLAKERDRLIEAAERLSSHRREVARALSERIIAELDALEMGGTRFEVNLGKVAAEAQTSAWMTHKGLRIDARGYDRAAFYISPNVGEALKPLTAIASGGELSRLILAIKAILADSDAVETLIFDEVDAGIGGGIAEVVGQKLKALARHHQVICITHLPQIARFGDAHFKIVKQVDSGRTATRIAPLDDAARLEEIARMLGGVKITAKTRAHARELLRSD
ncbi:MAG: DNA repair protein RecN [Desulfobacterales bacterium]|nr:DNA repair protein RecN [Desulfobacterales bacterium]